MTLGVNAFLLAWHGSKQGIERDSRHPIGVKLSDGPGRRLDEEPFPETHGSPANIMKQGVTIE
jgi:hypothetical protein